MGWIIQRGNAVLFIPFAKLNFHSFAENLIAIEMCARDEVRQVDLREYMHTRHIESLLVRISSRVHVTDVSRQM